MARGLTTAIKAVLSSNKINPVTLIYLGIGSGTRYTDHYKDISYDGNTYTASSLFLGSSEVTEESNVAVDSITIAFTGADQTIISLLLNNQYMDKDVEVYKGFLNSSQALIADPFLMFKGRIESFSLQEVEQSSQVSISIASNWADFEKIAGRKTNTSSQELFFDGDLGFDFASQSVQQIKWGKE